MKTINTKWMVWGALAFAAVTFVAWKTTDPVQSVNQYSPGLQQYIDTVQPRKKTYDKKEYKTDDLDHAMKELDHAMAEMDGNLKIDLSQMNKELKIALAEIQKIDFEKINEEIRSSLKNIDWDKTSSEVNQALRKAELRLKEVDMKQIEKEVAMAKESVRDSKINANIDMKKIHESIELGFESARRGIEHAKKEIAQLKEFTNTLEKDGLIDKKKAYKIEIKDNEMYIDGKKQSKEVNEKYKKYFRDEDYTIKSDGDDTTRI